MNDLFTTAAQSRALLAAGVPSPQLPFAIWECCPNGEERLCAGLAAYYDHGNQYYAALSINELIELIDVPVVYITKGHEYMVETIEMHYTWPNGQNYEWTGSSHGPSLIDCLVRVALQYLETKKLIAHHSTLTAENETTEQDNPIL